MAIFLFIPDPALREAVTEQLAAAKLPQPRLADSGPALLKLAAAEKDAVILLDHSDKKNAELAQAIAALPEKPVLLLLGGEEMEDASETFAKPLRLGHLIARLRYYLETAPLLRDRPVSFGPYILEPQNRRLLRHGGGAVRLTEKETALLVYLAGRPGPAPRRDILAEVWGYDERIDTHTLETHIYQLRRKLEKEGENWLVNEAGAYRLARETQ